MGCFEGKCFERPKNEIKRSGKLQGRGSRVKVMPAGDLVIGVHPNAERPSQMENMNAMTEGAIEKRGYNSAQRDCGCAKDYNLPEPFVDKMFPKPLPPPVFNPEPPPKYEPKGTPEEFFPIPEPELKDNPKVPENTKKPGPPPPPEKKPDPIPEEEEGCTGYEWLPVDQQQKCCDELETIYGGDYTQQQLLSEMCTNSQQPTQEPIPSKNNGIPPLSQVGPGVFDDEDDDNTYVSTEVGGGVMQGNSGGGVTTNVIVTNTSKNTSRNNGKVTVVQIDENGETIENPAFGGQVMKEGSVGSGTEVEASSNGSGFTVDEFQGGNVTPQTTPGEIEDDITGAEYEQEMIDSNTNFSVETPVYTSDSMDYWTGIATAPGFEPVIGSNVGSLAQQDPVAEEADVIGQGTSPNDKPIVVAPSSGMNLGLDEISGMPRCNSIVRSVTVSRCGDENPYDRGIGMFDPYENRHADPPGFVVDKEGRKVLRVKTSSGMRTRISPAGVPGTTLSGWTDAQGRPLTAQNEVTDASKARTEGQSHGPNAGAVTASVFNSLTNVAGDAFQYMNNQDTNRIRLQIANLQQQRDIQLAGISSGNSQIAAAAQANLAQINQQGEALRASLERDRIQMQGAQQAADRDLSFRTTALIAGSVLVLGMVGAGIFVATKK